MRLLVLAIACPCPADNGHKMRSLALLRALAAAGYEVALAAQTNAGDRPDLGALQRLCARVELLPRPTRSLSAATGWTARLRALGAATPFAVARFRDDEMRRRVRRLIAAFAPEAIICDTVFSALHLPAAPAPFLLHAHNAEHRILERFAALSLNPLVRLYARREASLLRRFERDVSLRAAAVLVCSEPDAAIFRSVAPATPVLVAPNIVDPGAYAPSPPAAAPVLVFQGGLDWLPNRDALRWFARAVLPRLLRARPDLALVAAGHSGPPRFQRWLARQRGMSATGRLADLRPVVRSAAVCVVPLRIGGGTRLKILEAAALSRPIVSTRLGAEGLDFTPGEEILIADRPADFAAAVLSLLADPDLGCRLGQSARRRVERDYAPPALSAALAQALRPPILRPAAPPAEPSSAAKPPSQAAASRNAARAAAP